MAQITLYGLKNCDTCKKALKALAAAGHDTTFIDIRTEADLAVKVPSWLAAVGADALVNKRSTTWRALSDVEREGAAGDKAATLLINNATLVKRPVIETAGAIYVGWTKDITDILT